jgi:hypothetical protein
LNRRALGWMRFLWEKSTTLDNWSDGQTVSDLLGRQRLAHANRR